MHWREVCSGRVESYPTHVGDMVDSSWQHRGRTECPFARVGGGWGCLGMVRLAVEAGGLVGATMAHADAQLDFHGR